MSTNASGADGSLPASDAWRMSERASFWLVQLAPFVLALVVYSAALFVMHPDATGDEPHYMVAAQSLAYDGDLDLTNDYASRERTVEVFGTTLAGSVHGADYRDTGQLRPIRGIGMAALLAPAVALGGETGVRLLMVLIAALLADQLFRLLRDLGFRRRYAALGWVAVALCYPIIIFSSQVYPELAGALLIVVALRVMLTRASSPMALALASTAGALLVWLHVRFIPLSFGVLAGLVIAACRARGDPGKPRAPGLLGVARAIGGELARYVRVLRREWRTVTVPVFVPYVLDLALFAAVSQHLYGSANPTAPYRESSDTTVGSGGLSFLYEFALTDLFNPSDGWIPYVPVHWLGLAALGCLVLRFGWPAAAGVAVVTAHYLGLASLGIEIGFDFPARYLVILIPLIAIPIALAIQEVRVALVAFVPLLAVSLVFAAAAVQEHRYLYPASETPRLFGARTTASLWPMTHSTPVPTSYVLSPGGEFPPLTGRMERGEAVARRGDQPDYMLYGPYEVLKRSTYLATFELAVSGAPPDAEVVLIDAVSAPPLRSLASRVLTAREVGSGGVTDVTLEFSNPNGGLIQTRVYYVGQGTLRAGQVRVRPERPIVQNFGRLPDWPQAFGWVLATIVAGWLLVVGMKAGRRVGPQGP